MGVDIGQVSIDGMIGIAFVDEKFLYGELGSVQPSIFMVGLSCYLYVIREWNRMEVHFLGNELPPYVKDFYFSWIFKSNGANACEEGGQGIGGSICSYFQW